MVGVNLRTNIAIEIRRESKLERACAVDIICAQARILAGRFPIMATNEWGAQGGHMEIGGRGSFPRNTLGTATINIVLDHLGDFEIVSTPENPNRTVSWCSAPLPPDKQAPYDDRVTLYVIEASDAEDLFAQHPHAIGLIALQQDEPFSPDAPPFPADLLRQLVIVRSKTPISKTKLLGAVMSTVYSCLFSIREWAANLAGIVSREGTIQELIDESEQLFDNFIDVNDSTYSLIARTKNIEPADPLSTELVRLGCHNLDAIKAAESIGAFGEWRDQSDINVFGPDETVPFKYITCVLKDRNSYAGHIVMVCNNHDATPGMMDMFRILSNSCQQIVSSAFFNESPTALFLRKLIDNARLTQAYFDEQSSLAWPGYHGLVRTGNDRLPWGRILRAAIVGRIHVAEDLP